MKIEEKAEELLKPIVEEESRKPDEEGICHAFEIVDVEYVKEGSDWYLRAYIDKEGGININDCERISRAFEQALDAKDVIPDAYILEVSSPGLTRALKKDRDFERNLEKPVEVHLFQAMEFPVPGKVDKKGNQKTEKVKIQLADCAWNQFVVSDKNLFDKYQKSLERIEDDVYIVEAPFLIKILCRTDLDDYESLQYFQRVLISSGIIDALREKGIQEGDIVSVYDFEFEFVD